VGTARSLAAISVTLTYCLPRFYKNAAAGKCIFLNPFVSLTVGVFVFFPKQRYLCCQNDTALQIIANTMQAQKWNALNVTFDRLVCNNDMHNGTNTTSIVAKLSDESQIVFGRAVAAFEHAIITAGVPIVHRRASQEFFHSTVAVVDRAFPSDVALASINGKIKQWTGGLGSIRVFSLMMLDPVDFFFAQRGSI
jgi:hypothetical protein